MSNEYYVATPDVPPADTRSAPEIYTQAEFGLIAAGFDKMPALSSADRYRELLVTSTGLGLGLSVQEKLETGIDDDAGESFGVPLFFGDDYVDLTALNDFRIDAGGMYRINGFFAFAVSPTGSSGAPKLLLSFSEDPDYARGIAISSARNLAGTEFSTWQWASGGAPIDFLEESATSFAPLVMACCEFRGVIVGGTQSAFMSVKARVSDDSTPDPDLIVVILRGANIKLTRFYEE